MLPTHMLFGFRGHGVRSVAGCSGSSRSGPCGLFGGMTFGDDVHGAGNGRAAPPAMAPAVLQGGRGEKS